MTSLYGPLARLYWCRLPGLVRGKRAERHHSRHEAQIGVRFAGRDKLVHLIGLGEVVARLGRSVAERRHRPAQIRESFSNGNQLAVALTLHALFSHVPQTKQGPVPMVNARRSEATIFDLSSCLQESMFTGSMLLTG